MDGVDDVILITCVIGLFFAATNSEPKSFLPVVMNGVDSDASMERMSEGLENSTWPDCSFVFDPTAEPITDVSTSTTDISDSLVKRAEVRSSFLI